VRETGSKLQQKAS